MGTSANLPQGDVNPGIDPLQQAARQIEEIGVAGAAPFINSAAGQQTEQKVLGEVNLGIQLLPFLGNLFHSIGNLFHHAHKQASTPGA